MTTTTTTTTTHTFQRGELAEIRDMYGQFTKVRVLGRTRDNGDGRGHCVRVKVTARNSPLYACGDIRDVRPMFVWPRGARFRPEVRTLPLPVVTDHGDTVWQCRDNGIDHVIGANTVAWLMDPATDLAKTDVVEVDPLTPADPRASVREVTIHMRTPSGRESIRTYVLPE